MRTYTVHRPRRTAGNPELEAEQTIFVKEGFCWPALFIPFLWFIYHRMWLVLTLYVFTMVLLGVLPELMGYDTYIGGALSIAVQFVLAAEANDLRRWTLRRSGFEFVNVVHGPSLFIAESAYFADWAVRLATADREHADNQAQIAFRFDPQPPGPPTSPATPV